MNENETETIIWGPAPEKASGVRSGVWAERLAPFRENPGVEGRLPGLFHRSTADAIKRGKMGGSKPGEFKAVTRADGLDMEETGGKVYVYVTYLGDQA